MILSSGALPESAAVPAGAQVRHAALRGLLRQRGQPAYCTPSPPSLPNQNKLNFNIYNSSVNYLRITALYVQMLLFVCCYRCHKVEKCLLTAC